MDKSIIFLCQNEQDEVKLFTKPLDFFGFIPDELWQVVGLAFKEDEKVWTIIGNGKREK